jgi:formate hydrogenlyase subunit 6/NADH:ubiquinone oxidoreductase subunit I
MRASSVGIIPAADRLAQYVLGFDLGAQKEAPPASDFGLVVNCDVCFEPCPTRPIAEGDRLICLGCAGMATADKEFKKIEKSISPQKLKKLVRKEQQKLAAQRESPLPDTSELRVVNISGN